MNAAKILKWVGIGVASIFTIVILGLVSLEFFINDSYVARTVTKIAERSLNAKLSVKEIDFTAFSHFPHVGIASKDFVYTLGIFFFVLGECADEGNNHH